MYRQIRRHFERLILSGHLIPGQKLPTERELARKLGVNRSTITAAYDGLRAVGLIRSTQGYGTHVSEDAWGLNPGLPDWNKYNSQGLFQPTLPILRLIWDANSNPDIINLARGEISPDLWPHETIRDLLASTDVPIPMGYSDPRGLTTLRSTLERHLVHRLGLHVSADEILITAGAQEGLLLISQFLLKPGDAVAIEKPSYAYSLSLFASAGLRLFPIPVDKAGLQPEAVKSLHRHHKIQMIFVGPTFQNPTGTTLTKSRRQRLLASCTDSRIPIVEDYAYGGLELEGAPATPPPLATLPEAKGQVIHVGTLSKTFAPGLRIGWIAGPHNVIERLAGAKEQMDLGVSSLGQVIAERLIATGRWEEQRQHLQHVLTRRRNTMANEITRIMGPDVEFRLPDGGYHLWLKLRTPLGERELVEASLQDGVVVVPGSVYGADAGYVRLTYACASENQIIEGIARLQKALRKLISEKNWKASARQNDQGPESTLPSNS